MRVPGRGTVRNDRDRFVGSMRRVILDLDIHYRCESAQALGADAETVYFFVEL